MRGAALARAAGISVQQIRNYEAAGLLPSATRAANGYRVFTEAHVQALPVARQLVADCGWSDATAILGAVHAGDLAHVVELIDRGHARLDHERARIQAALQAFEQVVTNPLDKDPALAAAIRLIQWQARPLKIGQLADLLGIRTSALRFWERSGLLTPAREPVTGYRVYDQTAVRDAHLVRLLRGGNFPTGIIRAALDEMHSSPTGRADRVGAELDQRNRDLHRRSWRRIRAIAALAGYIDALGLSLPAAPREKDPR